MDEIVARLFGHSETIFPLAKRSKTFRQNSLAVNAVDGQDFIIVTVGQNRIDQKVTRSTRFGILAI